MVLYKFIENDPKIEEDEQDVEDEQEDTNSASEWTVFEDID